MAATGMAEAPGTSGPDSSSGLTLRGSSGNSAPRAGVAMVPGCVCGGLTHSPRNMVSI